jgi:uncharacterized protein YbjT (DUF2867 family)
MAIGNEAKLLDAQTRTTEVKMNDNQLVVVFNASSRQGLAQVRQLLKAGHRPRAVTRNATAFATAEFSGIETVSADFTDPASLARAVAGADAIFFQPPLLDSPDRLRSHARNVGEAARRAGVRRFIHNSTMWSPDPADYPCGQVTYDTMRELEAILEALGLPLVIFRPTLYMDNWLTLYAKPVLIAEHVYRYPHQPTLRYSPICLDDVAKFMIAALNRDDLIGTRHRIAGPQIIGPEDVRASLSAAMGVHIRYEYMTPADFAAFSYERFVHKTGVPRDLFIAAFDDFYTFNNMSRLKPFELDMTALLKSIPLELETFAAWAKRQDWTMLGEAVGSVSG